MITMISHRTIAAFSLKIGRARRIRHNPVKDLRLLNEKENVSFA
jgi:hypothetical protein